MNLYAEKSRAPSLRNQIVSFENNQTLKNYRYILYEIEKNIQTKQKQRTLFILIRQMLFSLKTKKNQFSH